MRKLAIAATVAVFTFTATAQQPPLQCLNPDVLNGVVFQGRSDKKMQVTRGLPAFMSGFRAPADFSLIGSGVYEGGSTLIAYKTPLAGDKAYATAVAALGAEGWTVMATPGMARNFKVAGTPREATLCRNGEMRSLLLGDVAGARYVNIHAFPGSRNPGCGALDLAGMGNGGPGDLAPRLQFPAGTSLAQGGSGGGGGSSRLHTNSTRIISDEKPAALVAHVANQLQGQGWRHDADWSGAVGAGSTWRRMIDGELLWGALNIIRVSEGTYEVEFTMALPQ